MADRESVLRHEAERIAMLFPSPATPVMERLVAFLGDVYAAGAQSVLPELTESAIRESETSLMVGRITNLARQGGVSAAERIGVSRAQIVLEDRVRDLRARRG